MMNQSKYGRKLSLPSINSLKFDHTTLFNKRKCSLDWGKKQSNLKTIFSLSNMSCSDSSQSSRSSSLYPEFSTMVDIGYIKDGELVETIKFCLTPKIAQC